MIGGLKIKNPRPMCDYTIKNQALPQKVILPILDNKLVVNIGDKVLTTQVLAKNDAGINGSPWVHAPISGEIIAIQDEYIPNLANLKVECIVIKSDNQDKWVDLTKQEDFLLQESKQLIQKLATSGIVGLGGAGFPSAKKLQSLQNCNTIIINGCECEPAVEADNALMQEYPREILRGTEILLHITKAQQAIIAIEDDKQEAFETLLMHNSNLRIKIEFVPTTYGSGSEKSLIKTLLNVDIKSGKFSSQYGILMQNVATTKAIFDFIVDGIPLVERVITDVTGNKPQNLMVRMGTMFADIVKNFHKDTTNNKHLKVGGLMMGVDILNVNYPVLKTTNAIFYTEKQQEQNIQECIRCGDCVVVCPANLLPQQLYWFAKAQNIDKCLDYNILDCTECRCCDEVCSSNIPLTKYFNFAKRKHFYDVMAKQKAELSNKRFEFREFRLERNKQERTEMMARKRAEIKAKTAINNKKAEDNAIS